MEKRPIFAIENPNKGWVVEQVAKLRREWDEWLDVTKDLPDSPDYNPQTCSEAIKDGWDSIRRHRVLREKTLVFIGNNFSGYEFLFENWPSYPHEDVTSRLRRTVPGWTHRLDVLAATIEYARVPDGFWKAQGKKLVEKIAENAPDKAADIAASWLKNPTDAT